MSYIALPKEVPKIEVKQVEKVVEAGLRFWFAKTTFHLVLLCTSQVPNIEYQDRLVEVREAPGPTRGYAPIPLAALYPPSPPRCAKWFAECHASRCVRSQSSG